MNTFVTDPVTIAYHELRSPLALMVSMARSAADDCADDALRSRCLSIVRTAERMLRTAGELMDVAATAKDDSPRRFAPLDVVRNVVTDYRQLGVAVTLQTSTEGFREVLAAPGSLEALLCSLLGNARDHGNELIPIRVTVTENSDSVVIEIRNGFARSRHHKGLGLGTYVGEQLARSLGATLEMSRSDEEFFVRIALPAAVRELALAI